MLQSLLKSAHIRIPCNWISKNRADLEINKKNHLTLVIYWEYSDKPGCRWDVNRINITSVLAG